MEKKWEIRKTSWQINCQKGQILVYGLEQNYNSISTIAVIKAQEIGGTTIRVGVGKTKEFWVMLVLLFLSVLV